MKSMHKIKVSAEEIKLAQSTIEIVAVQIAWSIQSIQSIQSIIKIQIKSQSVPVFRLRMAVQ